MPLEENKKIVIEKNMCFGCLIVGHGIKNCRKRATCNICRRSHPSLLREEHPQGEKTEAPSQVESASTVLSSVRMDNSDRTSMIVPVWLSCTAENSPETLVYALLDTQSSNTLINQDVCEKIQADTEPVKLKLSTMTDRGSIVNCDCERASVVKDVDLNYNELPMQGVLGVKWNMETDAFAFNVVLNERTATR